MKLVILVILCIVIYGYISIHNWEQRVYAFTGIEKIIDEFNNKSKPKKLEILPRKSRSKRGPW